MSEAAQALGLDGALSAHLQGFQPREEQLVLAKCVERAIDEKQILVGEAGTGVGKTFAYLVPILQAGKKTIIATGTRHLQDQLFHNDLPLLCKALGLAPKCALLKGRANYLCSERLALAKRNPTLADPVLQSEMVKIEAWAAQTRSGDISECAQVPQDAAIWSHVVSEEHHCGAHESEALEGCYVSKARRKALQADIVVVNQHLLCADLALKDTGFGELLPETETIVVDEAHQLAEVASVFFGERLSSRQLLDLTRDTIAAQLSEAPDQMEIRGLANSLETQTKAFRLAMGDEGKREPWQRIANRRAVEEATQSLLDALSSLSQALGDSAARGRLLEAQSQRAAGLLALLERFHQQQVDQSVLWYETYRLGFALNSTPLDVSAPLTRARQALDCAWILVSATLAVNENFDHFLATLGFEAAETVLLDSPFDYKNQALMYAPKGLPEPSAPNYTQSVIEAALPIIEAAKGRAFLLFTSHRALNQAEALLRDAIDYPLFVQGEGAKHDLLNAFKASGNGVLLGTSSFWEGVDVRGEALSLVVIDKLPFSSPGDPVVEARINALKSQGANAFFDYQLPQAIVTLKQGVGRLIRDYSDCGVLMICDPRLTTRGYGRQIVQSLPPMLRTKDDQVVSRFYKRLEACES